MKNKRKLRETILHYKHYFSRWISSESEFNFVVNKIIFLFVYSSREWKSYVRKITRNDLAWRMMNIFPSIYLIFFLRNIFDLSGFSRNSLFTCRVMEELEWKQWYRMILHNIFDLFGFSRNSLFSCQSERKIMWNDLALNISRRISFLRFTWLFEEFAFYDNFFDKIFELLSKYRNNWKKG